MPPPARPWRRPLADDPGIDGPLAGIEITVEDPELCPRFTARIFEFVTIAPSPLWMKARLMAAGQRPISNVVDVTNYVMLLTGQPMHAFDLDRIAGARLNVRHARPSEQMQTLDGQTRTLDEQMLLIEDGAGPTSIAGVMGGARSEVHDLTHARADRGRELERRQHPPHVARARSAQRGVGPLREGPRARAGDAGPGTRDAADDRALRRADARRARSTSAAPGPAPVTIRLRDARLTAILGTTISRTRCRQILESLEFTVGRPPTASTSRSPRSAGPTSRARPI